MSRKAKSKPRSLRHKGRPVKCRVWAEMYGSAKHLSKYTALPGDYQEVKAKKEEFVRREFGCGKRIKVHHIQRVEFSAR